eukprot:355205-Chlamydomonas_euryale.AAC.2
MNDFSGRYSSTASRCHEDGSGGVTTFGDFLKFTGRTYFIPWPDCRWLVDHQPATQTLEQRRYMRWKGRPGGRLLKTLIPWNFRSPQVGHMTWSSTRRGWTPTHSG